MGANRLQGTPWHEERYHRQDGDERRYKGRCKYYIDATGRCKCKVCKCIGSAHCDDYEAMTDEEFKAKHKSAKKTGEDDCFWY